MIPFWCLMVIYVRVSVQIEFWPPKTNIFKTRLNDHRINRLLFTKKQTLVNNEISCRIFNGGRKRKC